MASPEHRYLLLQRMEFTQSLWPRQRIVGYAIPKDARRKLIDKGGEAEMTLFPNKARPYPRPALAHHECCDEDGHALLQSVRLG